MTKGGINKNIYSLYNFAYKKPRNQKIPRSWQRYKDSNLNIRSQSPLCYHYTIPLNILLNRTIIIILHFWKMSRENVKKICKYF
jgi:hypothetical protein